MAEYVFESIWRIEAPIEAVWDAIYHSERWPSWWKEVESVQELVKGDDRGVGSVRRYVWKTVLPYKLAFDMRVTRVEPPVALEGAATGELQGTGHWQLRAEGDLTIVHYTWSVRTRKRWMNLLAPIARPIFAWNHHEVLKRGGEALARLLGVRLLGMENR